VEVLTKERSLWRRLANRIRHVFVDEYQDINPMLNNRGEIAFYNLGKFTQVITDFETIHYHSKPRHLYQAFANFLQYHAEDAYPEGWQNN